VPSAPPGSGFGLPQEDESFGAGRRGRQRLVGLEGERDELAWAMGVLEREWSGPDPDGPPPGAPGPVVIELRLTGGGR